MATQTGSIDLTASNSVKLAAEAGWQSDLDDYYTKSEIDVTVGGINSTVSTKVGEDEVISSINQSSESVSINASKINLTGEVTISDLASDAQSATLNSNISVGGRNLLKNSAASSDNLKVVGGNGATFVSEDGYDCYKATGGSTVGFFYGSQASASTVRPYLEANMTYIYSAWIKVETTASGVTSVLHHFASLGHHQVYNANSTASDKAHEDVVAKRVYTPSTINVGEWTYITEQFTTNSLDGSIFGKYVKVALGSDYTVYVRDMKLEKGNKATDWSPAPEDVDSAISDAAKTATSYVTNITGGGIMVHPSTDATSGVRITDDVDIMRGGTSAINIGTNDAVRIGAADNVQMLLVSDGMEIDNESGDGIFAIDSGSTGSVTIALDATLVTWSDAADVVTTAYTVSDSGAAAGDVAVTATVDGTDYALDSTYATATVTAGTGVSVALTSAGVTYVRGLMVETVEDDGSTVTTTYPCELSVEYQHAVTDVALLSLIGSQTIDGEGESLQITNSKWVANSRQSSTLVRLHNAITGRGVKLGVSSNGYTRGLWDSYKNDWVIARNKDNKTVINGPNFSVSSGGTVNASGTIASWYQVSAKGNGNTSATRRVIALRSNSAGNRGLYDVSLDKWVLYKRSDGTLALNDPLYIREDTCTVNTSNATIAGNVNHCWHNGAVCTITITVNLKASLATNSTVTVATAPSSYRPAHDVMGQVYITGQNPAELQARLTDAGAINLNNRSGSAVGTSANIYISFTFAL